MVFVSDSCLPPQQHGFRPKRQCAEIHQVVNKLREKGLEWRQPYVILKLDIAKAFDKVSRGAMIAAIRDLPAHPRLKWALSREIINTSMKPSLFGMTAEKDVPTFRGVKQGAPESGFLYCLTVGKVFRKLSYQWERESLGFRVSQGHPPHQYVAFADDTVLLARPPRSPTIV